VNGIVYSKYRQYCYFVEGLLSKYSVVQKFLEMEFNKLHDRKDNIPISLELRNLPTTIVSLCNIHGVSVASGSINQLNDQDDTKDHCRDTDNPPYIDPLIGTISKLQSVQQKPQASSNASPTVKCWLCDGPHSFRQCKDLTRVKTICAQRPQVRKHFQQLLLNKTNGDAIKVLLELPELFEDSGPDHADNAKQDSSPDRDGDDNVNSLQVLTLDTFTHLQHNGKLSDVTHFPDPHHNARQLLCDETDSDPSNNLDSMCTQDFFVLAVSDSPDVLGDVDSCIDGIDTIDLHPLEFSQIADDIIAIEDLHHRAHFANTVTDEFYISDSADDPLQALSSQHVDYIHSVSFDSSSSSKVRFCHYTTQVDGSADRCTTPHKSLVYNMRQPNPSIGEPLFLYDAGKHKHTVEGVGEFRIESWVDGNVSHSLTIPCLYIPTIPSTLVNFRLTKGAIMYGEISNLVSQEAIGTLIVGTPDQYEVHKIPLKIRRQRVYASNILSSHCSPTDNIDAGHERVAIVSDEATRLLWHSRLGHLNFRALSSLHLSVKGVSRFKQSHVVDQCETCLETKLRRSPRGPWHDC
jgi:hypothetical protein